MNKRYIGERLVAFVHQVFRLVLILGEKGDDS